MINELSNQIHQNAKNKGFYDGEINIGEKLLLIHSEVSEAVEADREDFTFKKAPCNIKCIPIVTGKLV